MQKISTSKHLLLTVLVLSLGSCFSQVEYPRPTFPEVFQVDVEGTFVTEDVVLEIDATIFYDRTNNRAALFMTKENDETRQIYNFNTNQVLTLNDNECEVEQIPDERELFPFTVVNGTKLLDSAEKAFFFTEVEPESQPITERIKIPTLVYKITGQKIDLFGKTNCDITHTFSIPDVERPTCKDDQFCNSSLVTILVECKDDKGVLDTHNLFRFSRMKPGIEDESVFLPAPGTHCNMSNSKALPPFPSYFSFGFDIIEKSKSSEDTTTAVFNTHKEIWYDAGYGIVRIDEFHYNGLLLSSKIFDFKDEIAFTKIATVPVCDMGPIQEHLQLDRITLLPKTFFVRNESEVRNAIYVGKRNVHGLDFEVWSLEWNSEETEETIVEELYFLQIIPVNDLPGMDTGENTVYQLSHIDMYIYSMNEDTNEYELSLLKHFSINNFKSNPKEWDAFDVSNCFDNEKKKEFSIKIEALPIAKGSRDYKKALELLYDQIVAVTGISIVRIGKLTGVFDGVDLQEIKGSIIDNSKSSGWPKENNEPGMAETFSKIEAAAREDKLSITFIGADNTTKEIKVISVGVPKFEKYPRPTFPDVFQVDVEGTFVNDNVVAEIDATIFYDRTNNKAALFLTKEDDQTRQIYNFDTNEILTINDFECKVGQIPDGRGFFPFTVVNGKKLLDPAEKAFFFTEEEQRQILIGEVIPTLVYKVTGKKVDLYSQTNCDISHTFSTPDVELPTCKDSLFCNSTLITILVECKNEEGVRNIYNSYRFSRMKPGIEDASPFLPPPGIHCNMSNSKAIPPFPSYFSFEFDIIDKSEGSEGTAVFNTHKEIWYDAEYGIVRIDEFLYNGLLLSSKIFDFKDEIAFTRIATVPTCDLGPIQDHLQLDKITRLPKSFFARNESAVQNAIYVGKRNVHGLDYEVWSLEWSEVEEEIVVEELYFLQIAPITDFPQMTVKENTSYQLSHVDLYIYTMNENTYEEELSLLKHFSVNNFKSNPKEWDAFDVNNCFNNEQKKEFTIKIEAFSIAKGSQDYKTVLEILYEKVIAATGISIVRIAKLTGVFDGVDLQEITGAIIDNSKDSGWPKENNELGMEETFSKIEAAAREGKLSITFKAEDNTVKTIKVISVEVPKVANTNSCYSGAYVAIASLVLLLVGILFGVGGYYVFLKKRRISSNLPVRMSELKPKNLVEAEDEDGLS